MLSGHEKNLIVHSIVHFLYDYRHKLCYKVVFKNTLVLGLIPVYSLKIKMV